jgi:hypothetical protein
MQFPKWKKTLRNLLISVGRVAGVSKNVALSAGLLTLYSGQPAAQPKIPVNELTVPSIPSTEIKKYSAKYFLKSATSSFTRLVQHRSHSSHSSHRSHSSHASHYSSSGGTAPRVTPAPSPPAPSPRPRVEPSPKLEPSPEPTSGLIDNFNDNVRAATKWNIGAPTMEPSAIDSTIGVNETGGRLEITPRLGVSGRHYNGYFSTDLWDVTDARAAVQIAQTPGSKASMVFALAVDSNNWYGFVLENGTLYFQSRFKGVKSPKSVPYNAAQHRFWRFRHNAEANLLLWETSSDGTTWFVRDAETPQVPLTGVYVALSAGSYQIVKEPGTAAFDNFQLTRNR